MAKLGFSIFLLAFRHFSAFIALGCKYCFLYLYIFSLIPNLIYGIDLSLDCRLSIGVNRKFVDSLVRCPEAKVEQILNEHNRVWQGFYDETPDSREKLITAFKSALGCIVLEDWSAAIVALEWVLQGEEFLSANENLIVSNKLIFCKSVSGDDDGLDKLVEKVLFLRQDFKNQEVYYYTSFACAEYYYQNALNSEILELLEESEIYFKQSSDFQGLWRVFELKARAHSEIGDYSFAVEYFTQALDVARLIANPLEVASVMRELGDSYRKLGRYDLSRDLIFEALEILDSSSLSNLRIRSECLSTLTNVSRKLGNYDGSLEYAYQQLDLLSGDRFIPEKGRVYLNIAYAYHRLKLYKEADLFLQKALVAAEVSGSDDVMSSALRMLAGLRRDELDFEESLRLLDKAQKIDRQSGDIKQYSLSTIETSIIYAKLGQIELAISGFEKAIVLAQESNYKWSENRAKYELGRLLLARDQEASERLLLDSFTSSAEMQDLQRIQVTSNELYRLYTQKGDFERALIFLEKSHKAYRAMNNAEVSLRITSLKSKHERQAQKKKIEALKMQNSIKELELAQHRSHLKLLENQAEINRISLEKEKLIKYVMIGVLFVFLLSLFSIWNRYIYIRKTQTIIQEKGELIHRQNEELQVLNRAKDRFMSIIAHDLRGPIRAIFSILEQIESKWDQLELLEIRNLVLQCGVSTKKTLGFLENLLEWSQLQVQHKEVNLEKIELNQLFRGAIDPLAEMIRQSGVTLVNEVESGIQVHVDVKMMETVFRNLICNAVKFTPAEGQVTLSAKIFDAKVKIDILDSGMGIEPGLLKRLFKINERVSTKGLNGERGNGLGLILCKELIEKNNGEITLESRVGEGSCFSIILPF